MAAFVEVCAVMQVALDAGALDIGRADRALALRAGRAHLLGELGLAVGNHDREGDDAVQQREPDDGRGREDDTQDADERRPCDGDVRAADAEREPDRLGTGERGEG
jgi:hypothetical protein